MEVPSVGFCYNKNFTHLQGFIYLFFLMNSQVDVRKMWEPVRGSAWKQHVTASDVKGACGAKPRAQLLPWAASPQPRLVAHPWGSSRGVAGVWLCPLHAGAEGADTWPWPCCVPRGARYWAGPTEGGGLQGAPSCGAGCGGFLLGWVAAFAGT